MEDDTTVTTFLSNPTRRENMATQAKVQRSDSMRRFSTERKNRSQELPNLGIFGDDDCTQIFESDSYSFSNLDANAVFDLLEGGSWR